MGCVDVDVDVDDAGLACASGTKSFVILVDEFTRYRLAVAITKANPKSSKIIIESLESEKVGRKNDVTIVTTAPDATEPNSLLERTDKEIFTRVRCAIAEGVPRDYWDLSLPTILERMNIIVSSTDTTSPKTKWDNEIARKNKQDPPPLPSIAHWRTLGSQCSLTVPNTTGPNKHRQGNASRLVNGVLIGQEGTHGYIIYSKETDKVYRTQKAKINEKLPEYRLSLVTDSSGVLNTTEHDW
ncbi:uncharacterized protein BROUX77_002415 [Berkeleyomyces rouxiae]|uniref:uncharacterized protein n=1 Tax=Berkeleyomyces rouxiae TaxID=2035830 RepID=UPI003B82B130